MKISVIIPTYNEEEHLEKLLKCLQKQIFKDFEIIVADNNSTDKTREIAKQYGAVVTEGGLPAKGRNTGAKKAQGEVLFFLDADVLCDENFLEKNIKSFEEQALDFAMPRIKTSSSNFIDKIIFGFQDFWIKNTKNIKPYTMGFATIVKKKFFEDVGGYDEKMNLGEDADLGFRLKKKGYKFGIVPYFILVSARRFIKNGRVRHSVKMLYSGVIQSIGIDPDKHLDYEWGYNKKDKS